MRVGKPPAGLSGLLIRKTLVRGSSANKPVDGQKMFSHEISPDPFFLQTCVGRLSQSSDPTIVGWVSRADLRKSPMNTISHPVNYFLHFAEWIMRANGLGDANSAWKTEGEQLGNLAGTFPLVSDVHKLHRTDQ